MLRTKFKYENKQRAITQKLSEREVYGSYALHSPLMRSIHPQNFITLASIVLEICSGQRMGDAAIPARQPATGDNIIRPVFDGRIKRQRLLSV